MLACGMNGYPLGRLFRNLDIPVVLPLLAGVAKHFASVFGAGLRTMAGWPELGGIVRQSGLLAPTADTGAFVDMLKGLAECDTKAFLATYEKVAGDPAPGALEGILAPTMLVLGDKDRFMPRGLSEQIAAAIPGTEVHEYEGATHFLPLEFPARLSGDIKEFLDKQFLDRLPGVTREKAP